MNTRFLNILAVIFTIITLYSCQKTHQTTYDNYSNYQKFKLDSIRLKQKEKANDSIKLNDNRILMDFYLGMTQKEFRKAEKLFKKEYQGRVFLYDIPFTIYMPEFEKNKLVWFTLGSTCDVERINGMIVEPKYKNLLIQRYLEKYGEPDQFLDEDYQECDSTDKCLRKIVWRFDTRVFVLCLSTDVFESSARFGYELAYTTPERWDEHVRFIKESKENQLKEEEELKAKQRKLSDEI